MNHYDDSDDEWQDDDWQEDDWQDDDWDGDDSAELVPCPACGQSIYEEAEQCPACGEYITTDTSVWSGKPWWWILVGLIGIAATVLALIGG